MSTRLNSIRVGFCTGNHFPDLGGMQFVNHSLAEALNNLPGVKISVACNDRIPPDYTYPYAVYPGNSLYKKISWRLYSRNRARMIKKEKINLLYGPMLDDGGVKAMRLKNKFDLPMVVSSRGFDVQTVPEIGYGACLVPETKKQVQNVLKNADHIISLSRRNKQQVIDLGGEENRISIIPNGVKFNEIQNTPFVDPKKQYGIKPEDFTLITVGRNKPVKRMELLFKAIKLLKNEKKFKCICVGPENNLGKLSAEYGIQDKVILTGRIPGTVKEQISPPYEELINLYRCSDVYISPSYVECFSNAALEALSCGTPVIVGRKHGIRDVLQEGYTGFVMQKETPEELSAMITDLKQKKNELMKRKKEVTESVKHLTWNNISKEVVNIYKKVLN